SFNYLGQLDQALQLGSMFEGAPESTGAAHSAKRVRDHLIDVNAPVTGGRLSISFAYSEKIHQAETIAALGERFTQSLRRLVEHCRDSKAGREATTDALSSTDRE